MLYSKDTDRNLYMKPNAVLPGLNYTLVVLASVSDGAFHEEQYSLVVNTPPANGKGQCKVYFIIWPVQNVT